MIKKLTPQQLRRHKGVSFTGVTTVFVCHDGKGKMLLAKRGQNARDENGRWDAGAGGLKHGQTVVGNLKRELLEEYCVEPIKLDFLGYSDIFRQTDDGQPTHWLGMYFVVLVDPASVKIGEPDMIDEIGWFELDNLPRPLHSEFDNFMNRHGDNLLVHMGLKKSPKS